MKKLNIKLSEMEFDFLVNQEDHDGAFPTPYQNPIRDNFGNEDEEITPTTRTRLINNGITMSFDDWSMMGGEIWAFLSMRGNVLLGLKSDRYFAVTVANKIWIHLCANGLGHMLHWEHPIHEQVERMKEELEWLRGKVGLLQKIEHEFYNKAEMS